MSGPMLRYESKRPKPASHVQECDNPLHLEQRRPYQWKSLVMPSHVVKTPTIVYNLKMIGNGAWQKNFSPDSVVASSHVGSIVGGVLGGLALISGVVLGFIVYRRRKRAGAEKHSLPKGGGGVVTTDISPMAPPDTNRQPTQPSATLCLAVIPRPNSTIPSVLLQTPMTQYTTQDTPLQHSKSMTLWSVLKDT
ncbi:MAG: hypothetical protein JOS17DRAFT_815340 [Linnemannia elongata]|nr:MAG: hypothetical protein JOS17DRAFT_815340 [Linnemannia elongata]